MNLHSAMMQSKYGGKTRIGHSGKAGLPPQVVMIELKSRIFAALNKLSDRDTQQIALEDLESVAQGLSPDGISLFLSCLYDTDAQQKAVVRRECVKLFGTLASLHGDYLVPHLPRIVSNIVRRLKDSDSTVREACVDVMGVLALQVPYPVTVAVGDSAAGQTPPLASVGVYMKPLLEALTEQNKGVQVGASLCLARVLDKVENLPLGVVQRLVPRIVKYMSMPGFLAKAGLLSVIGSLAHAVGGSGTAGASSLTSLVPCAQECLESPDWVTRKAAADTLLRMAMSLGPALSPFKATVVPALDACRFDKVKPVRDSVNDAMAIWRNVPRGGDCDEPSPARGNGERVRSSGDMNSVTSSVSSPLRGFEYVAPTGLPTSRALFPSTEVQVPGIFSSSPVHPPDRTASPTVGDRKQNPEFFRKLDNLKTDEIQVPGIFSSSPVHPPDRTASPTVGGRKQNPDFFRKLDNLKTDEIQIEVCGTHSAAQISDRTQVTATMMHVPGGHLNDTNQSNGATNIMLDTELGKSLDFQARSSTARDSEALNIDGHINATDEPYSEQEHNSDSMINGRSCTSASVANAVSPAEGAFDTRVGNDPSMWTAIRRHLQQIERQQAQLMEMFQEFVASSQESMSGLEATVQNLERAVEKVGHDITASARSVGPDAISQVEPGYSTPAGLQNDSGLDSPDYASGIEETPVAPDLFNRSGEKHPKWMVEKGSLILDEYLYESPRLAGSESVLTVRQQKALGYMGDLESEITQPGFDSDQLSSRRGWESRESRTSSRSEGGARNVWQSANAQAKATLAAIRGAGYDGGHPEGIDMDFSKLDMDESPL